MERSRVITTGVAAGALALALGAAPAGATTWSAPADLPAGTWYGEAATGRYDGDVGDLEADPVTTLPGARVLLRYSRVNRPDRVSGPAWFWFNTRAGSSFAMTGCPDGGLAHAVRVPRSRFQPGVRAGVETRVSVTYDARGNAGHFEVAVRDEGQQPRPPGCRPGVTTPAPARPAETGPDREGVVVWDEGTTFEGRADDTEGADLRVHAGDYLLLDYFDVGDEVVVYRWYSTRGVSRYFLSFCDTRGTAYSAQVTRERFLARVAAVPTQTVRVDYDRTRDVGRFEAWSWTDDVPCEVRPR